METAQEPLPTHTELVKSSTDTDNSRSPQENALNPACNVIPDILIEVFQCLRSKCVASNPASLEWVKIAGVCKQWRAVALATPGLWRHIPIHNLPQFHHFAELSQQALLDIFGSLRLNPKSCIIIRSVMHRVQKLQLTIVPEDFNNFLELGKSGSADAIRELDIDCGEYHREINANDCWWYSSPNLESFAFTSRKGISLSDMPRLPTLRCLKLVQTNRVTRPGAEIISVLRRLPALESLHLEGLLPNAIAQAETEDRLTLPLLKRLALGGTPQRCSNFLRCVSLPGLEYINFVGCVLTSDLGLPILVQTLQDHFQDHPTPIEFQSLRYEEGDNCHRTTVTLWTTHDDPDAVPAPGAFRVRLVVHHDNYASSVRSLCSSLPVESVQNLHVCVGDTSSFGPVEGTLAVIARWRTTFQKLMQVRKVFITGHFPYELLNALCGTTNAENGGLLEWLYGPRGTPPPVSLPTPAMPTLDNGDRPVVQYRTVGDYSDFVPTLDARTYPWGGPGLLNVGDPLPPWTLPTGDVDMAASSSSGSQDQEHRTLEDRNPLLPPPARTPEEQSAPPPSPAGLSGGPLLSNLEAAFLGYDFQGHEDLGDYMESESEEEPEPEIPPTAFLPRPRPRSPSSPAPTRWTPSEWKPGLFPLFDYEHFKAEHMHILQPSPDTKGKTVARMVPDPSTVQRNLTWHQRTPVMHASAFSIQFAGSDRGRA